MPNGIDPEQLYQALIRRGLSDAEARNYVQNSFGLPIQQPLQQPTAQPQQPQGNFLSSLARAAWKPAGRYLGLVGGAGYELARQTGMVSPTARSPFLTEQELGKFQTLRGGLGEAAKRTAGAAAYVAPAAFGLGPVAGGALGGGLAGYGVSRPGKELEETALGAGTGALTGWALQKILGPKPGITKAGQQLRARQLQLKPKPWGTGAAELADDIPKILDVLDDQGVKITPVGYGRAIQQLRAGIKTVAKQETVYKPNYSQLSAAIKGQVNVGTLSKGDKFYFKEWLSGLKDATKSPIGMSDFYDKILHEAGPLFTKEGLLKPELSPQRTVIDTLRQIVGGDIKTNIPQIASNLDALSLLHKYGRDVVKTQAFKLAIPAMFARVPIPGARRLMGAIGKGLEQAGRPLVSPQVAGLLGRAGSPTAGALVTGGEEQPPTTLPTPTTQLPTFPQQMPTPTMESARPWVPPEAQFDMALTKALMAGNKKAFDLLLTAKKAFYPTATAAKTEREYETKLKNAMQATQKAIEVIQSPKIQTGILAPAQQRIAQITGRQSPEMTQLRSQIAMARTLVRNALLGAQMTQWEIQSLEQAMFDINLPKNILIERMNSLIDILETFRQQGAPATYSPTSSMSGFNQEESTLGQTMY